MSLPDAITSQLLYKLDYFFHTCHLEQYQKSLHTINYDSLSCVMYGFINNTGRVHINQ